jgi:hypothetical protein
MTFKIHLRTHRKATWEILVHPKAIPKFGGGYDIKTMKNKITGNKVGPMYFKAYLSFLKIYIISVCIVI